MTAPVYDTAFNGKTVIVTGASSGLGAALAMEFARRGAKLGLFALDQEGVDDVAVKCLETGAGGCVAMSGDVNRPEDCRALIETTAEAFDGIDYLMANAGVSMWTRFDEVDDVAIFRKIMDVNYLGVVHCVHAALPYLKQSRGMISAISSIQAKIPVPLHTGYVASKFALQGFLDTLRMELADTGVSVLSVLPFWLRGTQLRASAYKGDGDVIGADSKKHNDQSISLEYASRAIIRAMARRKRQLIMPSKLKLLPWLYQIAPRFVEWIVRRAMVKQQD
jgi:short-subunit dehydrogenase